MARAADYDFPGQNRISAAALVLHPSNAGRLDLAAGLVEKSAIHAAAERKLHFGAALSYEAYGGLGKSDCKREVRCRPGSDDSWLVRGGSG
ncbi:hypothetical protein D3C78_1727340 [compost metagenome]